MVDRKFWKNKRVLITGHTGFKGAWLSTILSQLECELYGYALRPVSNKQLYVTNKVEKFFKKIKYENINNYKSLKKFIQLSNPQIVFHLAAQPIVLESYREPLGTFITNIIGSANLIEALRFQKGLKSLIIVTSDKCYLNKNKNLKYFKEEDSLGGFDPYSASKAGAEIIAQSYFKSFFEKKKIAISTVRAGNVIGGGDISKHRIFSDISYSLTVNKKLIIRNPNHTRPWQHVLEPITGYIILAEKMYKDYKTFSGAWNFGPKKSSVKRVIDIVRYVNKITNINYSVSKKKNEKYESKNLGLNINKVLKKLKWKPRLGLFVSIKLTIDWYLSKDKKSITLRQINDYLEK